MRFFCPQPLSPIETTELKPRSCVAWTIEQAKHEIAKINCACLSLSKEIEPCRKFLESAYKRLAALNQQRHTLDLFIFENKLSKKPPKLTKEDFKDWLGTLSLPEVEALERQLIERERRRL